MTDTNIYQTPTTDPSISHIDERSLIEELVHQSTWRLFFLTVITLGIYSAHYIKRQTNVLNKYSNQEHKISHNFVTFILVLSYISAASIVPYQLVEEGHWVEILSDFLDLVWLVSLIVWAFEARRAIQDLLGSIKGKTHWFHGFWTFVFTELYFNYKINSIDRQT